MTRTLAALGAAIALAAAGCGSTTSTSAPTPAAATPAQAKKLLAARLRAKQLDFRWVACVRNGRTYRGVEIVRCNVNFGDPHIVQYCAVVRGSRLVTDHEDVRIRCGRRPDPVR